MWIRHEPWCSLASHLAASDRRYPQFDILGRRCALNCVVRAARATRLLDTILSFKPVVTGQCIMYSGCDAFLALRSYHDSTASSKHHYTTSTYHMVDSAKKSGDKKRSKGEPTTTSSEAEFAEDPETTPPPGESAMPKHD